MLRFVIYVILAYILYRVVKGVFSPGTRIDDRTSDGVIDEMIQDPNCKTYIPRRDAIKKVVGGKEYFFCSEKCASEFEAEKNLEHETKR